MRKRNSHGMEPDDEYLRRKSERFAVKFSKDSADILGQNEEFIDWLYDYIRRSVSEGVVELPEYGRYAIVALADLLALAVSTVNAAQRKSMLELGADIAGEIARVAIDEQARKVWEGKQP